MAFVRAMYENPPMKPLFSRIYHVQSDELLGSWFFFLGCLPFIPYCLVYLAQERTIGYLGVLIVSILLNIGAFFFVLSCYPKNRVSSLLNKLLVRP
jgi:hypothetical protein